ncbi:ATP-binding protein [Moraxella atlantae]|uniref:ATP-binding protein n=1 Tax=Faucicola atlantae TaxID=34059 RepID=UPI0037500542
MKLLNKNPLQSYAESACIANSLVDIGIVTVNVDCPTHGIQRVQTFAFRQDQVKCPECDKLIQAQKDFETYQKLKRDDALRSGIAKRYYGCKLDDWQAETERQRKLLAFAKAWLSDFDHGSKHIAMIGPTGTGKTMLASILAGAVMEKGYTVKMLRSSDIAEQVRATWKPQARESEADLMHAWINCDLLVIDEFGEGDIAVNPDWADQDRARLSKIIDGRYQNGMPIIFTSNFDRDQFFARLGARALDRLQENMTLIVCNWQSYRAKAGVTKFMQIV